jgi:plasmid stabilization system protein ParE
MMLPYLIRVEAEADLNEAYNWYERQRQGLGADFLLCFEETLQKVRRNPEVYPRVHKTVRRGWLRRFPYGLFFIVEDGLVVVLGIFHAARDPQSWQSRS